ncbi:hypothetical protein K503DRAFT_782274 [Rhizopogon vinicolor AM-OR11-026]|uniref:Uncharacterized protein n=1 Tax=Rhizopogon vinicolor AM-OR11-026 TaxID=1314800 RepID=A0A1B7N332_9AGAM|nr:hypothetical protein K503DRAFT_782274 [Rhizopogon vinicolor AM-OR11-026]
MKFIALITMIVSVAVMAGADDTQILGRHCAQANGQECGHLASHNNGKQFVYWCGSKNTIDDYSDCNCYYCCVDSTPAQYAYCNETTRVQQPKMLLVVGGRMYGAQLKLR